MAKKKKRVGYQPTVVRQNRYARVLSYARGATYVVQERVGAAWEDFAIGYTSSYRPVAISVYEKLTAKRKGKK